MRKLLGSAVLRTREVPGLRALYRGAYAAATAASARALLSLPGMGSVHLHRGLTREGWEPGLSDIDLVLVRAHAEVDEAAGLSRLSRRLSSLRCVLPMLGDVWLGTPAEYRCYLRWGGLRVWEDLPHWRRLGGTPLEVPELAESPAKLRWLDAWVWLFTSHMELSRRLFRPGAEPDRDLAHLRKFYLDVRRYADFLLEDREEPASRAETRRRLASLDTSDVRALWLDSSRRLALASRRVLGMTASAEAARAPLPPATLEPVVRLAAALPDALVAVNPPYHTWVVLKAGASSADYERAAAAFAAVDVPGVPVAIEPETWALVLQSSYLGAPLGWLGGGAGVGSERGAGVFPGFSASALGPEEELRVLDAGLRREVAAEAASWMLVWWRALWIDETHSNRFLLFHLLTRALGLRLALAGEAPQPFSDWEVLLARSAARFPEDAVPVASLRALLYSLDEETLGSRRRDRLPPGLLNGVARLMDGLRRAVEMHPGFGIIITSRGRPQESISQQRQG